MKASKKLISCKGCRCHINNFQKFMITDDKATWDCQQCNSRYKVVAKEDDTKYYVEITGYNMGNPTGIHDSFILLIQKKEGVN